MMVIRANFATELCESVGLNPSEVVAISCVYHRHADGSQTMTIGAEVQVGPEFGDTENRHFALNKEKMSMPGLNNTEALCFDLVKDG